MADFVPSVEGKDPVLPGTTYTLSYSTEYGTAPSSVSISALTASELPELVFEGYTFEGWYYDSAYTNKAEVGDSITSNTTLYAKWEAKTVPTATFDLSTLNLSAGTHSITVKLSGEGYRDSEHSNAVQYTVKG